MGIEEVAESLGTQHRALQVLGWIRPVHVLPSATQEQLCDRVGIVAFDEMVELAQGLLSLLN